MNSTVYSVNPINYSLTINNFTPLLHGDYKCILTYDSTTDANELKLKHFVIPVSVATRGSSGIHCKCHMSKL